MRVDREVETNKQTDRQRGNWLKILKNQSRTDRDRQA